MESKHKLWTRQSSVRQLEKTALGKILRIQIVAVFLNSQTASGELSLLALKHFNTPKKASNNREGLHKFISPTKLVMRLISRTSGYYIRW